MLLAFFKNTISSSFIFKFFTHATPISILGSGFPNRAVVDAYIKPEVNQSRSKFSWVEPDLDALRDYLEEKIGLFSFFSNTMQLKFLFYRTLFSNYKFFLGWNRKKFDAVVVPVLQKFASKEVQYICILKCQYLIIYTINSFFQI